jgi:hypothetical protein
VDGASVARASSQEHAHLPDVLVVPVRRPEDDVDIAVLVLIPGAAETSL